MVMKRGTNPSLKSWKKFPVYPSALNTKAGLLCVTLHWVLCGAEVRVNSLTVHIAPLSHFLGYGLVFNHTGCWVELMGPMHRELRWLVLAVWDHRLNTDHSKHENGCRWFVQLVLIGSEKILKWFNSVQKEERKKRRRNECHYQFNILWLILHKKK